MKRSEEQHDHAVPAKPQPQQRLYAWLKRLRIRVIEMLLLTGLLFGLAHLTLQNYHIDGRSMEPTLHNQEYILVSKASYLLTAPTRGDVIVFRYPLDTSKNYLKRIIAIPGDVISVTNNTVTVNGITLHERYVNRTDNFNPYPNIHNEKIPTNDYFVLGDNRGDSSDSRAWGLVPRSDIIGKTTIVYWPLNTDNFGFLPNMGDVFAKVPDKTP
jgi:signal peptidase I